jgi:iron complex outermembrane receptor protein
VTSGVAPATYAPGGLITAGPLRGTYFGSAGQTGQLTYGAYNPAIGPWMVGGDTRTTPAGHLGTNSLIPDEERIGLFNRTAFDVNDRITVFGQISWNRYSGRSSYQQTPSTGVTILRDNAYLQSQYAQIAANLATLGLNSIAIGTSNSGFPVPGSSNRRDVYRYLGGVEGSVDLLGRRWEWSGSYQHGVAKAGEALVNVWNTSRMALAQDAVVVGGRIICRSTIGDAGNGCVPIDRLGTEGPSPEALAYVFGSAQPRRDETISQDVASIGMSGPVFALPGGDASLALGGEWRREGVSSAVDPALRSGWLYGNYQPARGHYSVREAYAEIELPIVSRLTLNAAGRVADYSTSGTFGTWKTGASWELIDGIRLRGTYSRDIRAPNLADLPSGNYDERIASIRMSG